MLFSFDPAASKVQDNRGRLPADMANTAQKNSEKINDILRNSVE